MASPLLAAQLAVSTTEAVVPSTGEYGSRVGVEIHIDNRSAADCYVGPTGVTTATGIKVAVATEKVFTLRGDAPLYVIAGSSINVNYLVSPLYPS